MDRNRKKYLLVWLSVILLVPFSVYRNISIVETPWTMLTVINFLQRVFGFWAILMLANQIVIGAFMDKLTDRLGGWLFDFHVKEGMLAFFLLASHPLLLFLFYFIARGQIDPFYIFTDVCVLCEPPSELYISLGRVAFWALSLGILAGYFRTHPAIRKNWKAYHVMNYFAFFLVAAHAYFIGSDSHLIPLVILYFTSLAVVSATLIFKIALAVKTLRS